MSHDRIAAWSVEPGAPAVGEGTLSCSTDSSTLRSLLSDKESSIFVTDGVADVINYDFDEIQKRLSSIHRALVLHGALLKLLGLACETNASRMYSAAKWRNSLAYAIDQALDFDLISNSEAKHCMWFNKEANRAKHALGMPF